jgi:hypothetical protein
MAHYHTATWYIIAVYFCELRTAFPCNTVYHKFERYIVSSSQVWQDAVDAFGGHFGEITGRDPSKFPERPHLDTFKYTAEQDNQNAFKARKSAEARSEEEGQQNDISP